MRFPGRNPVFLKEAPPSVSGENRSSSVCLPFSAGPSPENNADREKFARLSRRNADQFHEKSEKLGNIAKSISRKKECCKTREVLQHIFSSIGGNHPGYASATAQSEADGHPVFPKVTLERPAGSSLRLLPHHENPPVCPLRRKRQSVHGKRQPSPGLPADHSRFWHRLPPCWWEESPEPRKHPSASPIPAHRNRWQYVLHRCKPHTRREVPN